MAGFAQFCIAGTHSGSGKTTITLGILAALRRRGLAIQPFKCGPDYIDTGYHRQAADRVSANLDTWMMGETAVCQSFAARTATADVAVVEGVMGLFDGADNHCRRGSSADIAVLLNLPVILVVPARGMARSIAALVSGYSQFDREVEICGVIANNVSSARHAAILSESLAAAQLPPLLGWLPHQEQWQISERHLGLIADCENAIDHTWYEQLAAAIETHLDLDAILQRCQRARPQLPPSPRHGDNADLRLGIAEDAAFHFYYADNLQLLRSSGIELVPFSPLRDPSLPANLHGLYIGGGFPEMFASELSANAEMRAAINQFAAHGGKIYAECGGLMYLCRHLADSSGHLHAMCNVFSIDTHMQGRLRRLGYVEARTLRPGPFGTTGTQLRGHEFHWSALCSSCDEALPAYDARHPRRHDPADAGLCLGNVWASYIHVHFANQPAIAAAWRHWLQCTDMNPD